jgi:hypothetical protein
VVANCVVLEPTIHCTVDPLKKLLPAIVIGNDAVPATTEAGVIPLVVLILGVANGVMLKSSELELTVVPVVAPGFATVTVTLPTVAKFAAGIIAVRLVEVL